MADFVSGFALGIGFCLGVAIALVVWAVLDGRND